MQERHQIHVVPTEFEEKRAANAFKFITLTAAANRRKKSQTETRNNF
jgi:hypothetical protein